MNDPALASAFLNWKMMSGFSPAPESKQSGKSSAHQKHGCWFGNGFVVQLILDISSAVTN
jgi:hypothetical protein